MLLKDWSAILAVEDHESVINELRFATRTGRPLGSGTWIDTLEQRTVEEIHRGRLYVLQSKPGEGTTVRMTLKG